MWRYLPFIGVVACTEGSLPLDPTGVEDAGTADDSRDASIASPRCGDGVLQPSDKACFFPQRLPFVRGEAIVEDVDGDGLLDIIARAPEGFAWYRGPLEEPILAQRFAVSGERAFLQDLDGDGNLDLLLQDAGLYRIYEIKAGTFAESGTLPIAEELVQVRPTDLDGDGLVDLTATAFELMTIWRRNASELELTSTVRGFGVILFGDANGDGITDILYRGDGTVSVGLWRGLGGARFEDDGQYLNTSGFAAGDFDGDGSTDLAYQDQGTLRVRLSLQIEVSYELASHQFARVDLEGDGTDELLAILSDGAGAVLLRIRQDGIEQIATIDARASSRLSSFRFADLNRDDVTDIVFDDGAYIRVAEQLQPGRFDIVQTIPLSPRAQLAIGHLDPDLQTDLSSGDTLFPGARTTGEFHASLLASDHAEGALADVDGDGVLDLISAGSITPGNGDGTFQEPILFGRTTAPLPADVNRDGLLDLVYVPVSRVFRCTVAENLGAFEFETFAALLGEPGPVPISDFDADGHFDLIAGDRLWFGDGSRKFTRDPLAPPVLRASDSALVDLQADGDDELLVTTAGGVGVFAQTAPGAFVQTATLAVPSPVSLFIDGDRLYVLASDASYWIYHLDGLTPEVEGQPTVEAEGRAILVADVSGDGRPDLVIATAVPFYDDKRGLVQVFVQDVAGNYALGRTFGSTPASTSFELADVDGDGMLDVGVGSGIAPDDGAYHLHLATP